VRVSLFGLHRLHPATNAIGFAAIMMFVSRRL